MKKKLYYIIHNQQIDEEMKEKNDKERHKEKNKTL